MKIYQFWCCHGKFRGNVASSEMSDKLAALHVCTERLQQLKQDDPQAVQVTLKVHRSGKNEIHSTSV
jgi:ATP-dependent Clp protease adapter protein ClpS